MKIHALQIGSVKITQKWHTGQGRGLIRLVNTLTDSDFTNWLPIYAWVIEHPEGLIVVDTGIPSDANAPIYFPPYMPLIRRAAKFDISPEQEIGPQLRAIGFAPEDVRWVVLTHLHQDHDGGLHYFPNAEFMVSQAEWAAAKGFKGRMSGYLNHKWPEWFAPSLVNFDDRALGSFPGSFTLTQAGDVQLVPTPGHSAGHLSVVVQDSDHTVFIGGDTSYSEQSLLDGVIDGVSPDPKLAALSQERIRQYAAETPVIYLPSHDPDAATRLVERSTLPQPEMLREKV